MKEKEVEVLEDRFDFSLLKKSLFIFLGFLYFACTYYTFVYLADIVTFKPWFYLASGTISAIGLLILGVMFYEI